MTRESRRFWIRPRSNDLIDVGHNTGLPGIDPGHDARAGVIIVSRKLGRSLESHRASVDLGPEIGGDTTQVASAEVGRPAKRAGTLSQDSGIKVASSYPVFVIRYPP